LSEAMPEESVDEAGIVQFLTFELLGQRYALVIVQVREIIAHRPITHVPMMPRCIRGVFNLRGQVVPVVDLGIKFGQEAIPITGRTCVVVMDVEGNDGPTMMALIADSVTDVVDVDARNVEPVPDFGTTVPADHLVGMIRVGDEFVPVLDVERILAVDTLLASDALEGLEVDDLVFDADFADGVETTDAGSKEGVT
jgi:purine-binding chemotaxis protein CheW